MDEIRDLLNTELFAPVRVKHVLELVIVLLVARVLWRYVNRRPTMAELTTAPARCSCGWRGLASKHRPRCPRCGHPVFLE